MVEIVEKDCEEVFRMLAVELRPAFFKHTIDREKLQEIRLRVGEPLLVVYEGKERFITGTGELTTKQENGIRITRAHIMESLEYISNYSMYAHEEELRQGYLTLRGGHRVGVAGKLQWNQNQGQSMGNISFLNIRLAHEIIGCSDTILPYLREQNSWLHTLFISPPRCGKTTLLRDVIRQISDGVGEISGCTVGVVDERSEIGACYQGQPQNHVGCRTDILDGFPKAQGMMMLVRSMAPQVIAVDEIGSKEDMEAIEYVMNCGVKLLATVHGNSIDEIQNKPILRRMVKEHIFERYVVLEHGKIGVIQAVFDARGTILFPGNLYGKREQAC